MGCVRSTSLLRFFKFFFVKEPLDINKFVQGCQLYLSRDKLELTGRALGRVFNFRSGCMRHTMHLLPSVAKQPNLELKTRPKQLLGSLPLVIALPDLSFPFSEDSLIKARAFIRWYKLDDCYIRTVVFEFEWYRSKTSKLAGTSDQNEVHRSPDASTFRRFKLPCLVYIVCLQ
jgi:hypothetical protein